MRLTCFTTLVAALAATCIHAAPAIEHASHHKSNLAAAPAPEKRQEFLDVAEFILDVAFDIWDLVQSIDDAQHDAESAFTQAVIANLTATYPTYNAIIFHDQDSEYNFYNAWHQHYELDLPDGPQTQGYEIWVLEYGWFNRVGDGGYLNWCFGGSYEYDGVSYVTFNQIACKSGIWVGC